MEDKKIERWTLDDGRRAERWVIENEGERVVEIHMEEERPLHLQQRIIEKSKPMVYERETAMLDKNGNIVDKKIESLDQIKMQMVDNSSKEEFVTAIVSALQAMQPCNQLKSLGIADEIAARQEETPKMDKVELGLLAFIGVLAIGLCYMLFFM